MDATDQPHIDDDFVAQLTATQLPMLLYVRSLLPGDPGGSDDVAQQANAVLWRKRADFVPGTNFKAWAFAVARYEVLNHRKKQARESRLMLSKELEETIAQEIAERSDDEHLRQEALQVCLDKLRPKDRELLMQRYGKEVTLKEYANHVDRSVNGLKVTLHRLRSRLLDCITHQLKAEERANS